ncbi:MAG: HD domain-containing protein [Bacillota bacterium]|nr:HD domain-containing protein [Bacillota bacterium]
MSLTSDEKLSLLFSYAGRIALETDLNRLLEMMAQLGKQLIRADRCSVWLCEPSKGILWTPVAQGVGRIEIPFGSGIVGRVVRNGKSECINDPYQDPDFNRDVDQQTGYRTRSILTLPLYDDREQVMGAFQAVNKITDGGMFSEDDLEMLQMVTTYSAKALTSAFLIREIESTQREVIETLSEIVEGRSKETGGHIRRVAELSCFVAKLAGLSEEEIHLIRLASPMHDIGKIGISDAILLKEGPLTDEEFRTMESHTEIGHRMLVASERPIFQAASIIAYEHHEKWNGKGYPRGLREDAIHIYGRITAIADVFDALASQRSYKPAWEIPRIRALFEEESGKHFDPELTRRFLEHFDEAVAIWETYRENT